MNKILLVDDEPDIIEFLKYNLEQENFEVLVGYNGKEALKKLSEKPDLIVLDIMMPGMDGFEVYKKIREEKETKETPVIFLTAKAGETDEIKGLDIGASDYIQKPISPRKLIARVKANLRKIGMPGKEFSGRKKFKIGPIEIDSEKHIVKIDTVPTFFPRKEFQLLKFLAENHGKVFSRESLLKEIWGTDVFVVDRTVDVHVRKIREKMNHHSKLVETIKGIGYRFKSVE